MQKYYEGKRILVTGGSGFIGSRLSMRLAYEERAHVRVLVHHWWHATWISTVDVNLIQGDMVSEDDLLRATKDIEIVFHCANSGPEQNILGLETLIKSCIENRVKRLIFFSTIGVLGNNFHDNFNESAPYKSIGNSYAESKIQCEKILKEVNLSELEWSIIRPTYVWGPNSPYFTMEPVKQMLNDGFFLVNEGSGICNAVYVDNVVDLTLIMGLHPNAVGEVFNISDGQKPLSWGEFFSEYARLIGKTKNCFKNVNYPGSFKNQLVQKTKRSLCRLNDDLSHSINNLNSEKLILVSFILKIPRKLVRYLIRFLLNYFPQPYDEWDLIKFSQYGFLDISKSYEMFSYCPQTTLHQGMENCRVFLENQQIIAH